MGEGRHGDTLPSEAAILHSRPKAVRVCVARQITGSVSPHVRPMVSSAAERRKRVTVLTIGLVRAATTQR